MAPATPELSAIAGRPAVSRCNPPEPAVVAAAPQDSAIELAGSFARGDTLAVTAVEECAARCAHGQSLNAFTTSSLDRAIQEAAAMDAARERGLDTPPLAGVPIAHKDILLTAGIRTAAGSALAAGFVPEQDARAVELMARAGAACMGKLNTHEFATGVTGTVSADGPTLNPWDPQRVPGGSSCGSAAAVAAGLVPIATGTDTGGSLRIPPSCCGVVGFKPTYESVSRDGVFPFAWSLDHVGVIARTVSDVELAMGLLYEPTVRSLLTPRPPHATGAPLAGIRFCAPDDLLALAAAPVAAAVAAAATVLEKLGAERVELGLPPTLAHVDAIAVSIFLAEGGAYHAETLASHPDCYQQPTRQFLERAAESSPEEYGRAQRQRSRLKGEFASLFDSIELLVCPTLPITAPPVNCELVEMPTGPTDVRSALTTYTRAFNLTGLPALSVPCGFDEGLPIGLQLVGADWNDRTVLCAGAAYQAVTDWVRRPQAVRG